jgi:hypothetical protein
MRLYFSQILAFKEKASECHRKSEEILIELESFQCTDGQKKAAVLNHISPANQSFAYIRPVSVSFYVHKCVGQ